MATPEVKKIVGHLRKDTVVGLVGRPGDKREVEKVFIHFQNILKGTLPTDYMEFIAEIADGFSWNSHVFCGVNPLIDTSISYEVPDIISYNHRMDNYLQFRDKLLIGHADEDVYCFNPAEKVYEVLDRMDGMVYETYETFDDLFTGEVRV